MTPEPALGKLMVLIAAMRPDWDPEQIVAELAGCPWSLHLAVEAVRATGEDDARLNVAHAVAPIRSQRPQATPEQITAYVDYLRRQLTSRTEASDA